jgi:hypothetical protein
MKKVLAIVTLVAVMSLGLASLGICSPDSWYYSNHKTTVEDLTKTWGQPNRTVSMADGTEAYIYKQHDNCTKNRYFIVKDGMVVDGGLGLNR